MRLELSAFIESDLDSIASYIAADNPRRALTFLQEIRAALRRIAREPLLHQLRPDIGEDARLAVHKRYVILYRIVEDTVRIERIAHGSRLLPPLLP